MCCKAWLSLQVHILFQKMACTSQGAYEAVKAYKASEGLTRPLKGPQWLYRALKGLIRFLGGSQGFPQAPRGPAKRFLKAFEIILKGL